jgi:hypothetical protein
MTQKHFRTNLRCGACVAAIAPVFDADSAIKHWSVDIDSADKTLTVEGDGVEAGHVDQLLRKSGYQSLGEMESTHDAVATESKPSYFPLLVILAYLLLVVGFIEWAFGGFDWSRAMSNFMASFFLVFSFFKMLDLPAFADSYAMYDIVAKRSRAYSLAYPFIELALGLAYLTRVAPTVTNLLTLIVMGVSAVGVVQSLVAKRKIRCACLGAVFNLPMSTVTLIEDALMAGMAAWMLVTAAW